MFFLSICRERSWIGIYTSIEINYAIKLNYKILDIFEIFQYSKTEYIFQDFIKVLAHYKIKVS